MDKWLQRFGWVLLLVVLVVPVSCTSYDVTIIQAPLGANDEVADAQSLFNELNLPTVLIQAEGGLGSGVVFSDFLVLTAAHVVSHRDPTTNELVVEKSAIMKTHPGSGPFLADVTIVKIDPELDLAVLKLGELYPYGKAKFATSEPYLYQKCWVSGHPHGVTDTTITEGRVQALWDEGFIRYSAQSTFGNSGGPVWVKVSGKFVVFSICQRVHTEGMSATTHLGLGVLPARMLDFVREYNQ